MKIEIPEGTLKFRKGKYVLYDIDYLLDHLSQEVHLLEEYRQNKGNKIDWEMLLSKIRELSAEDFKDMRTVKGVNNEAEM
jgi:DNA integrity scanning protein DisA with diadenylate cyclase activity